MDHSILGSDWGITVEVANGEIFLSNLESVYVWERRRRISCRAGLIATSQHVCPAQKPKLEAHVDKFSSPLPLPL